MREHSAISLQTEAEVRAESLRRLTAVWPALLDALQPMLGRMAETPRRETLPEALDYLTRKVEELARPDCAVGNARTLVSFVSRAVVEVELAAYPEDL